MKLPRRLLLLLLLLLPPLQGVAATLAQMQHALRAPAVGTMPCHESAMPAQAHAAESSVLDHNSSGSGNGSLPDTDVANHQCCHQPCTGTTADATASTAQKFSDVLRFVLPLTTLFIPDAPDRPPRA